MNGRLLATAATTGAALIAVAHAGPAVTSWPALRRRTMPGLSGIGDPGHVALTFDDGPHPQATPRLLDVLDRHAVRATFFMLGSQALKYPGAARLVAAAGHEIALHGHEHHLLLRRGAAATYDDLRRGRDALADVLGTVPTWWRPPYGALTTPALLAVGRLGLRPVLWTAWGRDWTATATRESVIRTVSRSLRGGGTVLLHDSDVTAAPGCWRATLAAVPALIEHCKGRGWSVGPLADHGIRS
jgi:peptidoglycan/xylan/chitin deacetylase (PgdA/CDA1 family)